MDPDFETQNTINHYRNRLTDIRDWIPQLTDTMLTISGYSMNLSGVTANSSPQLPGGDALTMLAPYSDGNLEPDDTPHPAQIIIEGAHAIDRAQARGTREYTFAEAWARNHTAIPWLHANGHLQAWAEEIDALWNRLGRLTGNIEKPAPTTWPGHITEYADQIPDHTKLTLQEADHFWPGIHTRIRTQRSRGQTTPTPDQTGRYTAEELRNYHEMKGHTR